MDIKEIITQYKNGDSAEKLSIISSITTIITAAFALITGQLVTMKFLINEITLIMFGIYMGAMAISILLLYFYLFFIKLIRKEIESFLLKLFFFLIANVFLLFANIILWIFILEIKF